MSLSDPTLNHYMKRAKTMPPLTLAEEQKLATRWHKKSDQRAFDTLMVSYLRLVVKTAHGYKGYGLPLNEMVQEGTIGLMTAINKYEPDKGFRLSTYAMWWIKAAMQEYILNNWSLVKIGTNSVQKRLFFNLRKLRNQLQEVDEAYLTEDQVDIVAKTLNVKRDDVRRMEGRINRDDSLHDLLGGGDSDEAGGDDFETRMLDELPMAEEVFEEKEEFFHRRGLLMEAMDKLSERERYIIICRRLQDPDNTPTLEAIAKELGISRERVRQVEARAYEKIQAFMQKPVRTLLPKNA